MDRTEKIENLIKEISEKAEIAFYLHERLSDPTKKSNLTYSHFTIDKNEEGIVCVNGSCYRGYGESDESEYEISLDQLLDIEKYREKMEKEIRLKTQQILDKNLEIKEQRRKRKEEEEKKELLRLKEKYERQD